MNYIPGWIDGGGFIYTYDHNMVHRETRRMDRVHTCSDALQDAAMRLEGCPPHNDPLVLALTPEGGVDRLWVKADNRERVLKRLETWAGCYGKWPVSTIPEVSRG